MENPSANGAWDAVPKDLGVAAKEWPLSESTQRIRRVFIISAWIRIVLAPVPLMLLVYTAVKIGPSCGFEDLDCLVIARSNLFMVRRSPSLFLFFRGRRLACHRPRFVAGLFDAVPPALWPMTRPWQTDRQD